MPLLADAPHCSIVLLFQRWRRADVLVGLTWWIWLLLIVLRIVGGGGQPFTGNGAAEGDTDAIPKTNHDEGSRRVFGVQTCLTYPLFI